MSQLESFKDAVGSAFEKGKEIVNIAAEKGGKAIGEARVNSEIASLKKKIKMSKIKLGDMIYQIDVKTDDDEIEELKRLIKNSLEELKYLENKKIK